MDYDLALALLGIVGIAAALLPRLLGDTPLHYPLLYVAAGVGLGWLGLAFHPMDHLVVAERLTELGVIVALMGSGLKLDRKVGWRTWGSTWRLLAITMVLTIAATAATASWVGLPLAAAVLAGAVLAPTDPVMASDVQVPHPGAEGEQAEMDVRFALTSEAGLNDGLAFPFTFLAVAILAAGSATGPFLWDWLLMDVVFRIAVGLAVGLGMGRVLALLIFRPSGASRTPQGFVVLAMTIVTYGVTQLLDGYGFIAVFVAAVSFRGWEMKHQYHRVLHDTGEQAERSIMAVLLVLFGAAIVAGVLSALTIPIALAAAAVVLFIRPLTGGLAMIGSPQGWRERGAIAFFGIRGIGSFYYLSFALNHGDFPATDALWAFVGTAVLVSLAVHGLTARPAMKRLGA